MGNHKWYLSTWFISIWFALSFLIVPLIIGVALLIMQIIENKKVKEEWEESGFGDVVKARQQHDNLIKKNEKIQRDINSNELKLNKLKDEIKEKKGEIIILDEEILNQSFGFYEPKYGFENSEEYKNQLDKIREKQKTMASNKKATNHSNNWTVDGSKKKGEALNNDNIKMVVRAFNNECDAAIVKVKFNNVDTIEKRIRNAYKQLNKLNKKNKIEIKPEYLRLKLDELYLSYEYQVKKEEEKEEQRRLKEQIKEEKRVQMEIEREKKKLEKDEQHFNNAIEQYKMKLENADEEMKTEIETKIHEIKEKLAYIHEEKQAVDYREQNAKAGYVYIISNIGSFGENIFKIGMTRRLEPLDRVNELGNASVPFGFDVHAMIFSEDAPKLENALHKAFEYAQVNKVNPRKEFFNVTLDEIAKTVKENHNKTVEFTKLAEAEEYRKSLKINNSEQTERMQLI
ncbi:DUF4041 domain-containing protein [Desertibacillus haloalkaliphilus]|nr:DUF4041 domain-containing protein [Desertibacillus haloalkaliphilus]